MLFRSSEDMADVVASNPVLADSDDTVEFSVLQAARTQHKTSVIEIEIIFLFIFQHLLIPEVFCQHYRHKKQPLFREAVRNVISRLHKAAAQYVWRA